MATVKQKQAVGKVLMDALAGKHFDEGLTLINNLMRNSAFSNQEKSQIIQPFFLAILSSATYLQIDKLLDEIAKLDAPDLAILAKAYATRLENPLPRQVRDRAIRSFAKLQLHGIPLPITELQEQMDAGNFDSFITDIKTQKALMTQVQTQLDTSKTVKTYDQELATVKKTLAYISVSKADKLKTITPLILSIFKGASLQQLEELIPLLEKFDRQVLANLAKRYASEILTPLTDRCRSRAVYIYAKLAFYNIDYPKAQMKEKLGDDYDSFIHFVDNNVEVLKQVAQYQRRQAAEDEYLAEIKQGKYIEDPHLQKREQERREDEELRVQEEEELARDRMLGLGGEIEEEISGEKEIFNIPHKEFITLVNRKAWLQAAQILQEIPNKYALLEMYLPIFAEYANTEAMKLLIVVSSNPYSRMFNQSYTFNSSTKDLIKWESVGLEGRPKLGKSTIDVGLTLAEIAARSGNRAVMHQLIDHFGDPRPHARRGELVGYYLGRLARGLGIGGSVATLVAGSATLFAGLAPTLAASTVSTVGTTVLTGMGLGSLTIGVAAVLPYALLGLTTVATVAVLAVVISAFASWLAPKIGRAMQNIITKDLPKIVGETADVVGQPKDLLPSSLAQNALVTADLNKTEQQQQVPLTHAIFHESTAAKPAPKEIVEKPVCIQVPTPQQMPVELKFLPPTRRENIWTAIQTGNEIILRVQIDEMKSFTKAAKSENYQAAIQCVEHWLATIEEAQASARRDAGPTAAPK